MLSRLGPVMFSKNLQMPLTFLWHICTGHCKVNHAIHVLRPLPTSVTQDNDVEILGGDGLLGVPVAMHWHQTVETLVVVAPTDVEIPALLHHLLCELL